MRPKVQPCRINFITALRYIVDEWLWSSSSRTPGAIPGQAQGHENIRRFVLPLADPKDAIRVRFA